MLKNIILISLICLPPFFTGGRNIFIEEFILILVSFLFLLDFKNFKIKKNLSYLFLSVFLFFSLISTLFSSSVNFSFILFFSNSAYLLLFFWAANREWPKKELDFLAKIILFTASVLSLAGLYFYLAGNYIRLTSFFWWPNPYASYLLLAMPVNFYWFWQDDSKFKLFSAPLLVLNLSAFILTGSRGAFLSLAFIILFYLILALIKKQALNFKKYFLSLLVIIIFSSILVFSLASIKGNNFLDKGLAQENNLDTSANIRLNYWQSSLEIFSDYFWLGSGLGTFGVVYPAYQKNPISSGLYPHNWYLEILAEEGILVFSFFVIFLFFIFYHSFNNLDFKKNNLNLAFGLSCLAFLAHNFFDIGSHYSANLILFWLFLGIFSSQLTNKNKEINNKFLNKIFLILAVLLFSKGLIFLASNYNFRQALEATNSLEVKKYFENSLKLNPDPSHTRQYGIWLYSNALKNQDREILNQALFWAEKAILKNSADALNYELRGRIYAALGEKKAEDDFKKAIELNKFGPRHYLNLAEFLISRGRKEDAKNIIKNILDYYPEEVVNNKKLSIMSGQNIFSGIEGEIERLKFIFKNL